MFQYNTEAVTIPELIQKMRNDLENFGAIPAQPAPLEPPAKKPKAKAEEPIPATPAPIHSSIQEEATPGVTFEQMKGVLQKVANTGLPGDENGAPLKRATKILDDCRYRKIKDVKPEDYQKIFDACHVALQVPPEAMAGGGIF